MGSSEKLFLKIMLNFGGLLTIKLLTFVKLHFSLQNNTICFKYVSVAFLAFICNSVSSAAISFKEKGIFGGIFLQD